MKKNTLLAFVLFSVQMILGQITNNQINYELRVDQWHQTCDNDAISADDNEVRIGLTADSNTGGTTSWPSNGIGTTCTGNNFVRRWQADAPSTITNTNTLLYYCTNRNNISNTITIDHESWEEDGGPDCSSAGDACRSSGTWITTFKSAIKTPSRFWGYSGSADVPNFVTGQSGDFSAKTAWRYTYGSSCVDALNFGTLTSGVVKTHTNSNRSTPTGASAEMGYTNTLGNSSSEVYYEFTLSETSNISISTDAVETNFDTYLRLYNSTACGTQIAFSDDGGTGTTSLITTTLCAGTYVILVEGFGTNTGDFTLSVTATNSPLVASTISGITDGTIICSGTDPGNFDTSVVSSGGNPTLAYQWESSTTSNSTGFTAIATETNAAYDPTTITQTTWFRRSTTDACGTTVYSNVIQVIVNTAPLAANTISGITDVTVVCSGTDPGNFDTSVVSSGGNPSLVYQWESSTTSNSTGFTAIATETNATYDPTTITQTTWFRRSTTDACGTTVYSNVIQVIVNTTPLAANTINGITDGTVVCSGTDPGNFDTSVVSSGGNPSLVYQWESSTTSNSTGFTAIATEINATYDPTTITQTTWFRRSTTDACGTTVYSNVVQVVVNTIDNNISQLAGVLTADQTSANYQWYECPNTLLVGETNQNFTPSTPGDYKVEITLGLCVTESACETITVLSNENFVLNSNFTIYPNPAKGSLNVTSSLEGEFIIVNQLGQTVKSFIVKSNIDNTINISNLAEGIYFVKGNTKETTIISRKLLIKR